MEQGSIYKITFMHGGFWKEVPSANKFKYISGRKSIIHVDKETATMQSLMECFASVSKWGINRPLLFTYCIPNSRPKKIHVVATDDHLQGLMRHHANSRSLTLHVVVDEVEPSEDEADSDIHILQNCEPVVHKLQNGEAIGSQVPEVQLVDLASQVQAMQPTTEEQTKPKEILDDRHNEAPRYKFINWTQKSSKVADASAQWMQRRSVENIHICIHQRDIMDPQGELKMHNAQTGSVEMIEAVGNVQDQGQHLQKQRKLRSAVWNHMTRQHLGDGGYVAVCNHCKKKIRTMGTTYLKNHLKFCTAFKNSQSDQADADMNESEIDVPSQESRPGSRKRRNRSAVWNDMTKEQRGDGSYFAICNHCKKKMVGSSAKGTTHLKNHLRFCAAFKCSKSNQGDVVQLLLEPSERQKKWINSPDCFKFDPERSRQDFVRMLILHEYPFSIVNHVGFRMFLTNLQPQFKLASQSTIKTDCMKVYESGREKLHKALDKNHSRVCFTANMWTTIKNIQYLCLTCHFIDADWKLQKRILNFVNVKSLHDTGELIEVIKDKLCDWHINGRLLSFVLGDFLTNDVALRELLGHFCFWSELDLGGDLLHMRCFSDILNHIVLEGLKVKEVSNIVERIRRSLRHVMKSPLRRESFQRCSQQLGAPDKLLVLDFPTRWESTFLMLDTALEFKNVFSHLQEFDSSCDLSPSSTDWENVHVIVECLSLFHEVASRFCSSKHPTINSCFVDLCFLHMKLKEWCNNSSQYIRSLACKMFQMFENYWGEANLLPAIGSILDPRFKMKSIEYVFGQIYCDNLSEAYKRVDDVRQAFIRLYKLYSAQYEHVVTSHPHRADTCLEQQDGKNLQPSSRNTLDSMRKGLGRLLQETSKVQNPKADIDLYLDEGVVITEDDSFNVLNWWMQHAERYPILSMMARDVLAVPVSAFTSKSDFGPIWRLTDQCQSHLDPKTVENLLCAQHWLRDEMEASLNAEPEDSLSTIFTGIDLIKVINEESKTEGNLSCPSS